MANLIKIGHIFVNLDRVRSIQDLFAATREDKLVVRFGPNAEDTQAFSGKEADDLRTWLNSVATNLQEATEPNTRP